MHSANPRRSRSALRRTLAVLAATTLATGAAIAGASSAQAAPDAGTVSDATFTWGLSGEAGGGAFAGGCNFLSAGTAGNTGSSRTWTEADGFYSSNAGNVTIVKPDSTNTLVEASWATKCLTPAGTAASAFSTTSLTQNAVRFAGGTGTAEADGSVEIEWSGSFTIAFYGGMTYWTASDPVLTLDPTGNGTLTATASGYGTSMEDQTQWSAIAPQEITLADITAADVDNDGLTVTPDYLGVATTSAGAAQVTTGAVWGSFPQDFIDFQGLTGQTSYWYSSGGSRDAAKPASPLAVAYTLEGAETPVDPEDPETPADSVEIEVTVPTATVEPESGSFGWSFADASAVELGTATQAGSTFVATGDLSTITVSDTRAGGSSPYSWSIAGQVSDFTAGANSFSATALGWTPSVSAAGIGVVAGAAVEPELQGGAGLAASSALASSTAAAGATVDAELELVLPTTTPAGDYTSTLTITALS